MTWYVVADPDGSQDENDAVWTLSRSPNEPGWNTDQGFPGYGLTKADAQFLADAANASEQGDVLPKDVSDGGIVRYGYMRDDGGIIGTATITASLQCDPLPVRIGEDGTVYGPYHGA